MTQVDAKAITKEEKFGYLLELVNQNVRDKIAYLKPGKVGYEAAWNRLKKEYGQTKLVINAHVEEIVNLPVVKGYNYVKIRDFYETLSKNYDVLFTLGEADMLKGFVMTTMNKLPQVKPDLVCTDDTWEDWTMAALIDEIRKWLSRHKVDPGEARKEGSWFTWKRIGQQHQPGKTVSPICIFCKKDHWEGDCKTVVTLEARRKIFTTMNCVLTVANLDIGLTNATPEDVLNAELGIILVYVTRKITSKVLSLPDIRHQSKVKHFHQ